MEYQVKSSTDSIQQAWPKLQKELSQVESFKSHSVKTFQQLTTKLLLDLLSNPLLKTERAQKIITQAFNSDPTLSDRLLEDLIAIAEQDPACRSISESFLYAVGWQAVATARVAYILWRQEQMDDALALSNAAHRFLGVYIHPAAQIGRRLTVDHGTGTVIGETSIIGDDVRIFQNVTLGSKVTRKTGTSRRHPKIENNVLIGAGAVILGAITIGTGAKIGAGAIITDNVDPNTTMVQAKAYSLPEK